jgi:xylan 1,4-beta-xylosidase
MDRRSFLRSATMAGAYAMTTGLDSPAQQPSSAPATRSIRIHAGSGQGKFPHIWEECAGSDRAIVGTREQWLHDLELVAKTTGIKSVRFHGLFNDEMGVWPGGARQPNFLYVDTVFDAMLDRGVKPFIELSFMPGALSSGLKTIFWYKGNTTPPRDLAQWGELVSALARHCIDRYGIAEVSSWNFEVWNEPNIIFWAGTKPQYFDLYRQSATALKSVDKRLRVGGPSTAQAAWVGDLLDYCASQQVPIDFVSSHIYPDDPQKSVFGEGVHYPYEEVIPRALQKMQNEIKASRFPGIPLYITEWSSQNPAFIAHTIKSTIGLADILSYWTFDNVFEELGPPRSFMNTSFGLIGMRGVPRPSYHTFTLLHQLGDTLLQSDDGPVLATRRSDSTIAVLVWNLILQAPGQRSSMGDPLVQTSTQLTTEGDPIHFDLSLDGAHTFSHAQVTRVDDQHGSLARAWKDMGSPAYPTRDQIADLKKRTQLPAPESLPLNKQNATLSVPPNGIALLEFSAAPFKRSR